MITDENSKSNRLSPPANPFSGAPGPLPPSYESVAFAYADDEVDRRSDYRQRPASMSSQRRELYTVATMPPESEKSEKEPPVYDYDDSRDHAQIEFHHSEAQCLESGGHITKTRFGPAGIAAALLWFPLGLGAMWLDRRVSCQRCNKVLREGCTTRGSGCGKGKKRHHKERRAKAYMIEGEASEDYSRRRQRKGCGGKRRREGRHVNGCGY